MAERRQKPFQADTRTRAETTLLKVKIYDVKKARSKMDDILTDMQAVKDKLQRKEEELNTRISLSVRSRHGAYSAENHPDVSPPPSPRILEELRQRVSTLMTRGVELENTQLKTATGLEATHSIQDKASPAYAVNIQKADKVFTSRVQIAVMTKDRKSETPETLALEAPSGERVQNIEHVEHLSVATVSTTINLDVGEICLNQIQDMDCIQNAIEDVLIAKIDWNAKVEKAHEAEVTHLRREIEEEKHRGNKQVEEQRLLLEQRTRERDQFMSFVLQMEKREERIRQSVLTQLKDGLVLPEVANRLLAEFDVRLTGLDSGLRFILDTRIQTRDRVLQQQSAIQEALGEMLLPERDRQEVTWQDLQPRDPDAEDHDLRLGQPVESVTETMVPLSLEETGGFTERKSQSPGTVEFDPIMCNPQRARLSRRSTTGDANSTGPTVTSLAATPDGRLVLADFRNKVVKVFSEEDLTILRCFPLAVGPISLAVLHDVKVAVASEKKSLYLIDVNDPEASVVQMQTARQYSGLACLPTTDRLIASCSTDKEGPASIVIITRYGTEVRTVVHGHILPDLFSPESVCVVGKHILLSEQSSDSVLRINLTNGRLIDRLTHAQLKLPGQVAADQSGNVYIASTFGRCVLVVSPAGHWRELLRGDDHGDRPRVFPQGVCATKRGLAVTWAEKHYTDFVVATYDLLSMIHHE